MKTMVSLFLPAVLIVCVFSGCATYPRGDHFGGGEPGLSDRGFTAYDVRLAVEALGVSMRNDWRFEPQKDGKLPVIAFTGIEIGQNVNYDVNVNEIAGWLEEQVVNTGKATFSNAIDPDRKGGRSGHQYKLVDFATDSDYVDKSSALKKGRILAPDYELFGRIYGYKQLQNRRITEVNYVIEMTLSNIETGTTAWKKMVPIGKNVPR